MGRSWGFGSSKAKPAEFEAEPAKARAGRDEQAGEALVRETAANIAARANRRRMLDSLVRCMITTREREYLAQKITGRLSEDELAPTLAKCALAASTPAKSTLEARVEAMLGNWQVTINFMNGSNMSVEVSAATTIAQLKLKAQSLEGFTCDLFIPGIEDALKEGSTVGDYGQLVKSESLPVPVMFAIATSDFIAAPGFQGAKQGYYFGSRESGMGYYKDDQSWRNFRKAQNEKELAAIKALIEKGI